MNSESWKPTPPAWLVHQTPGFGVSGDGQERRVQKNTVRVKGSQMSVENPYGEFMPLPLAGVVKNQGEAFYPYFVAVRGYPVSLYVATLVAP